MNIQKQFDTIARDMAHNTAQLIDGAAYAYVSKQLEAIKAQGLDPLDYEVVFASDEYPRIIEGPNGTTMKVNQYIRVVRSKDIPRE